MSASLEDRLGALRTLRAAGGDNIPEPLATRVDTLLAQATRRRELSPGSTVVGMFGATGSGKSSLVNALVGADVARTHVRRPTTSEALAVTWNPDGATDLLDWLGVRDRVVRTDPIDPRAGQLVLLDLPDFDSIERGNRAVAERLAAQVDALVWVVDPQKYADDVLHAQFITPHARHSEVTLIVLNQTDLLQPADVPRVVASLREIVDRDGIPKATVLPVSARTGAGIDAVRKALGDLAAARSARDARLAADIAALADQLESPGDVRKLDPRARTRLVEEVAVAAGADVVAQAVAGSYRKRSAQATGWPLVSWIARLRADPLSRLGLGARRTKGGDPDLHRTSLPPANAAARARVSITVRGYADTAAEGLTETWRSGIRTAAERSLERLPDALDLAIARTPLPARGSWWWVLFGIVQWASILTALVGVSWLLGAAFLPRFGLPAFEIPTVEGWAVPTLLIVGAVLVGILLGLLGGVLGAITAASRRRRARKRLVAAIETVVDESVVAPLAAERDRAREFAAALRVAAN
ncbi:GTPase family protein [Pseudolysinimonas sp.]|uniref:GTPase family protein n=1 Tax=Pseudolysinimonas sp. TaxID=2680009 RepID=UPI00378388F3